jgi:hypothetical protein
VDGDQLARLLEDAEDLAGVRAVDVARERTERFGEMPIPWEDVERDLGLAAAVASTASDGLFLRRVRPRGSGAPMSTLSMQLLVENVTAIDALVAEYESPSRPALCASALRDYLGASAS